MNLNDIKKSNLRDYVHARYGIKCDASGKASCPLHPPDRSPSFSIYQTKTKLWRWKCFHDDKTGSIIDLKMEVEKLNRKEACSQLLKEFKMGKISLSQEKLNQTPTIKEDKKVRHEISYDYKDEDGTIAYRKVKFIYEDGSKKIFFKHPVKDKPGLFDWTKGKHPHIPYNLDLFKGHTEIVVTEGEKDANTICRLKIGILATTAPAGKSSWPDAITPCFSIFKKIIFLYDKGAEPDACKHAGKLKKIYPDKIIYIAEVPMPNEGDDITDYLQTQTDEKMAQMALLDVLDKSKEFTPEEAEHLHVISVDKVPLKPVRWLWHNVFPIGKVSMLVGDGGAGKSYFANYMASRITTGRDWINPEERQPVGSVIIITTEDAVNDTIKARAELMGTDQTRLKIIDGVQEGLSGDISSFSIGSNFELLDKTIFKISETRLLVIDPITEFIGNIDDHRAAPTRSALAPLSALAEKHDIAILIISHLNKDEAKKLIYRTTGSQSYVNMARSVWAIAEDEEQEDRRFFMQVKQNLSKRPPAYAFSITEDKGIVLEDEPVKVVADAVFGTEDQRFEKSQLEEAKLFLLDTLQIGNVRATEIFKEAHLAGISQRTLERAKCALNVISYKTVEDGDPFWIWKQKK